MTTTNHDTTKFDFEFSGWSLWIEPEETPELKAAMEHLQQACGGTNVGVYPFVPHITLLYNMKPFVEGNVTDKTNAAIIHKKLQDCYTKYQSLQQQSQKTTSSCAAAPTVVSKGCHVFHYPKSFDNGNGFGCSIAFLNIQRDDFLTKLHQACRWTMGPDERGSNFVPHLSLVYAPEDTQSVLEEYASGKQCQHFLNQPFEAKYLSLWSTQGKIQEWYRIAKIPLHPN